MEEYFMKMLIKQGAVMACVLALLTGCGQQGNAVNTESMAESGLNNTAEKKVFEYHSRPLIP